VHEEPADRIAAEEIDPAQNRAPLLQVAKTKARPRRYVTDITEEFSESPLGAKKSLKKKNSQNFFARAIAISTHHTLFEGPLVPAPWLITLADNLATIVTA
jgi:hypothetical protein